MMRKTLLSLACLCAIAISGLTLSSFAQNTAAEYGKCGYYADSFQDRPTSSGEKYNKNNLTCSHKTLPFGTKIRVTRIDNKKSVVVRVNDRGPFIEGYVVDVSREAAEELDLLKAGTARVKIEVVESAKSAKLSDAEVAAELGTASNTRLIKSQDSETPATYSQSARQATQTAKGAAPTSNLYKVDIKASDKRGFGIQVTSLSDANNVLPIINKLQSQWPGKVLVNVVRDELDQATYKVFVGPFADRKAAEAQQKNVNKKYKKTMIVDLEEI
jgi:rare lipoprotein A